jgi:predicted DNA-binding protein
MMTTDDGETITAAQHAAATIEGRGTTSYVGVTRTISIRLPAFTYAKAVALAHVGGKSRNATLVSLLEVGIEDVMALLSPETHEKLREVENEYLAEIVAAETE